MHLEFSIYLKLTQLLLPP